MLKTTVTLTGSATVALARNPRRANTAIARQDSTQDPGQYQQSQYPQSQYPAQYGQQYSDSGEPVVLTPRLFPGRQIVPQQRPDDGYIYPADGSPDEARYPAPRSSRRLYGAQAYPQQQPRYDNGYAPAPPQSYQPRSFFQPRGYYQD